jgi:hypothetical protein
MPAGVPCFINERGDGRWADDGVFDPAGGISLMIAQ